jgi:hypothetical protein
MSLRNLSKPEGNFDYELINPGLYIARLQIVCDLGMKPAGQYGEKHKVYLAYEILSGIGGEAVTRTDGEPFMIPETLNLSLGVSGAGRASDLRARLGQFEGRSLTDEDCESIDLMDYLGRAITLGIIHNPDKKDPSKIYANIGSGNPAPPTAPQPKTQPIFFDFETSDPAQLPEWLQKKLGVNPSVWVPGNAPAASQAPTSAPTNPNTPPANAYENTPGFEVS